MDGNNLLHAYDANPSQDLDNDKNTDDGIQDFIKGSPFDEIWNVNLNGDLGNPVRISTPTVVTTNGTDYVVVTGSNGVTAAYDAFPRDAAGHLQTTSNLLWTVKSDTAKDVGNELVNSQLNKVN